MGICNLLKKESKLKDRNIIRRPFTIIEEELHVNMINNERDNFLRSFQKIGVLVEQGFGEQFQTYRGLKHLRQPTRFRSQSDKTKFISLSDQSAQQLPSINENEQSIKSDDVDSSNLEYNGIYRSDGKINKVYLLKTLRSPGRRKKKNISKSFCI